MIKFNMSYSSYSLYKKNQRLFYYKQIAKIPPTDKIYTCYGKSGNIVHNYLELFASNKPLFDIGKKWVSEGLDQDLDLFENPLSLPKYISCINEGKNIINNYQKLGYRFKCEEEIFFHYKNNINIKGIIDVVLRKDEKTVLLDYKTSNNKNKGEFHDQMLFYSWIYYEKYKTIPDLCVWKYLKTGQEDKITPTLKDINDFKNKIYGIIDEIIEKGNDESKYPITTDINELNSPFNEYISLMTSKPQPKEERKKDIQKETIVIDIIGPELKLSGLDEEIEKDIAMEFSYEMKGSYFIVKNMKKKGINTDGWKRFYNFRKQTLPIGFLNRLKEFLTEQGYEIIVNDKRPTLRLYPMPSKLHGIDLFEHQKNASDYAMENKILTIELATAGGKTVIGGEIIRRSKGLSVFFVDRDVLLTQTVEEFKNFFGEEIGIISEGKYDIKKINVAMIQTANSLMKKKDSLFMKFLANVKTLIIDEAHGANSKSYVKLGKSVLNARYRIGLTGTYETIEEDSMVVESVVGLNSFKIEDKELVEKGIIMKPKIYFFKYKSRSLSGSSYHDYYDKMITNNESRNDMLLDLVKKFHNKKMIILVDKIKHGKYLESLIPDSVFIHGEVDSITREKWLDEVKGGQRKIIIGTSSIIKKGLNIKCLNCGINATGNDGKTTSLQSLGRILRTDDGKEQPIYIDFYDEGEYFFEHTQNRIKHFKSRGHEVKTLQSK